MSVVLITGCSTAIGLEKATTNLKPEGNAYSDVERRIGMVFDQAAAAADDPADVAQVMVDTAASERRDLRIIIGDSGRQLAGGHANLSDEDYLQMCTATTEEYFGLFVEAYPPLEA